MDMLRNWIISVVTTVIFVTIVEMVVPNTSIKKYVKLATGLLVMVVILSPIFKLLSDNIGLDKRIDSYSDKITSFSKEDAKLAQEKFKNDTKNILKTTLKENIEKEIKNKTGKNYSVTNIELKDAKNELDFDGIKHIEIKKTYENSEVVPVEKIEIGESTKVQADKEVLKVLEESFNLKSSEVKFIK